MMHYILEVWLWMLGLYLIGCLIGALAWRRFGKMPFAPEGSSGPQSVTPQKGEGEKAA